MPPSFPVSNSTTSFWRRPNALHPIDSYRSSDFPSEADVVVIGAGYVGVSVLWHLLREKDGVNEEGVNGRREEKNGGRIVVLEAREACSGATGRNGGHLKPDLFVRPGEALLKTQTNGTLNGDHSNAPTNTSTRSSAAEAATALALFELRHLDSIARVVEKEGIDCDFVRSTATDVCFRTEEWEKMKGRVEALREAGVGAIESVEVKEGEESSAVKGVKGTITSPAAHLWPYKFVSSLLATLVHENGVNLQTHTPVTSISSQLDSNGCWIVTTERGNIAAKKVVVATNGYTAALIPELKDKIVPVRGVCSRIVLPQESNKEAQAKKSRVEGNYVLRFNEWEYDYLIARTDNSIVVGGARRSFYHDLDSWFDVSDDSTFPPPLSNCSPSAKSTEQPAERYFDNYMQNHFKNWQESSASTDIVWTGIMGYTSDGFPFVGEVPGREGLWICAGFNGHGMVLGWESGKAVAGGLERREMDVPREFVCTRERLEGEGHVTRELWEGVQERRVGV